MFHMMKDQRKNIGGNSNQKIDTVFTTDYYSIFYR